MSRDKEFAQVDREIARAANEIMARVERMFDRISSIAPGVHHDYVAREFLTTLIRDHDLEKLLHRVSQPGDATIKLSNALLDYRDSRWEDR
jgi:hypothetical protein